MKKLAVWALASLTVLASAAGNTEQKALEMLKKVSPGSITYKAENGWLYSKNELEHIAKGKLTNGRTVEVSSCRKKSNANPIPALRSFNDELAALGIKLIILPVPPKLAAVPCGNMQAGEAVTFLRDFYRELRAEGMTVIDISEHFKSDAARYYCRTDAHWSPEGIALAAGLLAGEITSRGSSNFPVTQTKIQISGDLAKSLKSNPLPSEELALYTVAGKIVDENSPVLLLGDSHTLIFSAGEDMLAENSGLAEQLAAKLNMPVDRIGIRGSAATAVRINLFRKAAKNKAYMKNKKYVIYCFSCREFTEAASGWAKVPVLRKK